MLPHARCAIGVPNVGTFGDPTLLVNLAVAAEEHGWDGFFAPETRWRHPPAGSSPVDSPAQSEATERGG